jgi:predicted membrane GTPase involved in stress response
VTTRFDNIADPASVQGLRYPEFPVRQLARGVGTRFQIGFARLTMRLLPEFKDVVLEASNNGLRLLAASETALALPEEILRQLYGKDVQFSEPEVRFARGPKVHEPIMSVRAAVSRPYTEPVLHELINRKAEIAEVDWLAPIPTIRAKAPLRELLGFHKALARTAEGKAELHMWLSHYAPMPPGPERAA